MPEPESRRQITIDVAIHSPVWGHDEDYWAELVTPVIEASLRAVGWLKPSEISVLLTGNEEVQQLNRDFRGQDKPTNVLSFPAHEPNELKTTTDYFLGDLAFAHPVIAEEAHRYKITFDHHLTHLVVHGTLHLLGYDHQTDEQAERMEALEVKILSLFNISNPY